MRKKVRRKTILIDGIRYYDDKPDTCRKCFFWKNRKVGRVLGTQNCYYLAEAVKTEQEKKCEGCCYAKGHPWATRDPLNKRNRMAFTHDRREGSGKEVPLKYSFSSLL